MNRKDLWGSEYAAFTKEAGGKGLRPFYCVSFTVNRSPFTERIGGGPVAPMFCGQRYTVNGER